MAILVRITQGTKEYLEVDLVDALGILTDFSGTSPTFDVEPEDTGDLGTYYIAQAAVVTQNNKVLCLVDTSTGGPTGALWVVGNYKLFVKFTTSPEVPRVGPFTFQVVA